MAVAPAGSIVGATATRLTSLRSERWSFVVQSSQEGGSSHIHHHAAFPAFAQGSPVDMRTVDIPLAALAHPSRATITWSMSRMSSVASAAASRLVIARSDGEGVGSPEG